LPSLAGKRGKNLTAPLTFVLSRRGEREGKLKEFIFNQNHFVGFCEFWRSQCIEIDTAW
jgi:hypothetical protein